MIRRRVFFAIAISLAGVVGIGAQCVDLSQRATSTQLAAATISATPDFALVASFDGGTVDAGTLPGAVAAALFFGQGLPSPTTAPTGLPGANVTLTFAGNGGSTTLNLADLGNGNYGLDSPQDPRLAYVVGSVYRFQIDYGGQTYSGAVTAGQQEQIPQFHPLPYAPIPIVANAPLTLNRTPPGSGQALDPAFTVVVPLDASGQRGNPTYTDVPATPLDLLNFVVDDSQWTQVAISIPGSAFPQPATSYLVTVTAVKRGSTDQSSSNLFLGSAFLVGSADLGLVQTQ